MRGSRGHDHSCPFRSTHGNALRTQYDHDAADAEDPKAAAIEILNSINPELVPESERPLPEALDCSECGKSIKLDKIEQLTGKYKCPYCHKEVVLKR